MLTAERKKNYILIVTFSAMVELPQHRKTAAYKINNAMSILLSSGLSMTGKAAEE